MMKKPPKTKSIINSYQGEQCRYDDTGHETSRFQAPQILSTHLCLCQRYKVHPLSRTSPAVVRPSIGPMLKYTRSILVLALLAPLTLSSPQGQDFRLLQTDEVVGDYSSHNNLGSSHNNLGSSDGSHEGHDHGSHEGDDHGTSSTSLASSQGDKPWGEVILAALLINLVTLIGLLFLSGRWVASTFFGASLKGSDSKWKLTSNIIPSFATGALLATSLFLIVPESLLLITSDLSGGEDSHAGHGHRFLEEHEEHDDIESAVAWRFGISVLGGFILPVIFSLMFPRYHEQERCEACVENVHENDKELQERLSQDNSSEDKQSQDRTQDFSKEATLDEEEPVAVSTEEKTLKFSPEHPINYPLATSIIVGDFFHNFTDGVFVGTAFLLCDHKVAVTIAAATVYHELAQEIADYFLLTKHCHLHPITALGLNFLGGLSVLLGALLILAVDVSSMATGCILAVGAGVYFYISGVECLPLAMKVQTCLFDKIVGLVSFVLGVVPIGLVLLNHGHCGGH